MVKKTLMVVDDEYLILETVEEILKKEGYEVITALSGKDALRKLKKDIDLVLIDILMPKMSGLELTKKIREDEKFKDINLAFLTILTFSRDQKRELKKFRILDYIQKPFDNKDLVKRVNKIINNKKGSEK